ncbi:phosphatase PAP2 family protein [Promethearchaeum syntrophicum]|uniref:Phosphatase PAP2 family protein n=1 Tax=Promethearchaeum syntrophicum TaxID=2594042 RepID=A0A5B9D8L6_9ARCH|nr:phosphatase PAP2 family protein [Candidatus Prometheoarchaeum syntrophicum]QEE15110.1 PAP2 superfamily protein [Candidatus Prometheoarchaeum syntrophicum]
MNEEKKYEPYHEITKQQININIIVAVVILVIGTILLALELNEAFYVGEGIVYDIFNIITIFGDEELYIVFFCVFYFGINKKFAKKLLIGFLITTHLSDFSKSLFLDPRPPSNIVGQAEGYGFPSGHSSGTLSFWGYTFFNFKGEEKKKRIPWRIFAMFLIILVPISRVIIGVHDLQDIIGGTMLGLLMITTYMHFEPIFSSIFGTWSLKKKILIGVACSLGLWIFSSLLLNLLLINNSDWTGIQRVIHDLSVSCGLLLGASIAFPIEEEYVKYDPDKLDLLKTILALLIGFVITFGSYFLLGMLFDLAPGIYFITRGIKYCLVVVIGALGVPPLLKRIFKM